MWVKLDAIGELFCGQSPSIAEVNRERRGIPYVTGPEQWDGSKIKETKWTEFSKRLVPEGCIFVTVKGAGVGKIFPGISCAIGRDIYAFLPSSKVDFKYTFHALMHQINVVIMKAQGDIPGLSKDHILDHVIGLCPLPEQRAIVSKIELLFSELENGIANLKLAQEQLKVYRQAVLKKAFEGELTRKWREQQTDLPDVGDLLEQIRKEREEDVKTFGKKLNKAKYLNNTELAKLPKLPKGWKWAKIYQVSKVGTGVTPLKKRRDFYEGGVIPWVTSGALNESYVNFASDYITEIALKETSLKIYPKNTLLVALYGEGKTRGKCSELLIEATTNQAIAAIVQEGTEGEIRPYLKWFFMKNYNEIRMKSSGGVQPNLNLGIIENTSFPLCSLLEQQAIVQEIETRLSVCDKIEQENEANLERAEALRQSILKKAFEGKLLNEKELAEVRRAEDWEPAEVLLERISAERAGYRKKLENW